MRFEINHHYQRGFTLLELMTALTVAALILAMGVPSFGEFRRNGRMTSIGNDFLAMATRARTEAIKRQTSVSVCPSNNANGPCTNGDFTGWLVFADTNANCLFDAGEAVLEGKASIDGAADGTTHSRSNGVCLSFAATGFLQPIAARATATRTLFCDSRGTAAVTGTTQAAARGILITTTGRARVSRDRYSGTESDILTWGVACP